jgi:hypothetical protein
MVTREMVFVLRWKIWAIYNFSPSSGAPPGGSPFLAAGFSRAADPRWFPQLEESRNNASKNASK